MKHSGRMDRLTDLMGTAAALLLLANMIVFMYFNMDVLLNATAFLR